jgi:hypothetical protein
MICLTGVLVATGIALLAGHHPLAVTAADTPAADGGSASDTGGPLGLTQQGPDGVTAGWVATENALAGSTNWRITNAPASGFIEGFADNTYARAGQSVGLYVSTSAASFHVEAYRIGYYGGLGGRLVWASPNFGGQQQPACPVDPSTNTVACDNWAQSLPVHITQAFPQGDYLLKLIGADNEQSYVPLTVWDPDSQATYVVKNDVFTWQSWNPYGGFDFYAGVGNCPAKLYPPCARARVVSYDRPYGYGQGAADFLTLEAPLVRFAEQHDLDVTYVNDLTVQQNPGLLAKHHALLSPGHDESWSLGERDAVTKAAGAGLNVAFFGAAAILAHVRTQASPLGADRELVDYRDAGADPVPGDATGNTWASPPTSRPGAALIGDAFNGTLNQGVRAPLAVADPTAWIFAGSGLTGGSTVASVIGSDVDSLESGPAVPGDVQVLAHSALVAGQGQPASRAGPVFYSDMTYYSDPAGGAGVWDSGTSNWIPALADCVGPGPCPAGAVGTMTGNLLKLFGSGPAGRTQPSRGNSRDFYPAG